MFAMTGRKGEETDAGDLPVDESKMDGALTKLAAAAEGMSEDDPRQAARLMRQFSSMTGLEFGGGMEAALGRLEAGEDPDKVESEMEGLLGDEDPFVLPGKKGKKAGRGARPAPSYDKTLHEL